MTIDYPSVTGPQPQTPPKAQVFVTASPTKVKTEAAPAQAESSLMPPPAAPSAASTPTIKAEPTSAEDPPSMALLKLHELAVANKLVERLVNLEL